MYVMAETLVGIGKNCSYILFYLESCSTRQVESVFMLVAYLENIKVSFCILHSYTALANLYATENLGNIVIFEIDKCCQFLFDCFAI